MKKQPPETMHLVIPPKLQKALKDKAKHLEINMSEAVRRAIHAWVEQQEMTDMVAKGRARSPRCSGEKNGQAKISACAAERAVRS